MGEETTQSPAVPIEAPRESLESRMTRAVDSQPVSQAPDGAPTLDGLPLEPGQSAGAGGQPGQGGSQPGQGGSQAEPAAQPTAADAAGGWQGVRDYAKRMGVELPYEDDAAALNDLIRARQQLQARDYYSELGQRFAPLAPQIQEYLRTRTPAAQPEAPWAPPKFDKSWLAMVERDPETGVLRAKPGHDPGIAEKVQAYADWRDRFLDNPEQVVAPLIEQRAQGLIEAKFAEYAQQTLAEDLVRRNAGWMFAADGDGGAAVDAYGRRRLSPAGVVYARAAKDLWDAGVRDVRQVDAYARTAAENAAMRGHLQQLRPPAQQPAQAVPSTAAAASVGGNMTRPEASGPRIAASQRGLSLREMLQQNLRGAPEEITL